MPRRPRIHLPEQPIHLVQRGHNRDACFFSEQDYQGYRYWLGEALKQSGCRLHAYVLMTNHVHLLLTPPSAEAVPQMMISLGRRYVQYINKTYRRSGTLWEGRYKSSLIQAEAYLLLCQRYIELNPVRAAMVRDPAQYRWSSYGANGLGQPDALLVPHEVYLALDASVEARLASYRGLFLPGLDDAAISGVRLAMRQNQPLGDNRFLDTVARMTGQRRVARPRGRPSRASESGAQPGAQVELEPG